jgi:hypothetical protein
MSSSEFPKLDSQILSSTNNKSFSEGRSLMSKNDSAKILASNKLVRNRLSEDNQFKKVSTLTEKGLRPIKRVNHSINAPIMNEFSKTPVKSINDKIDTISTISGSNNFTNLSESIKEQKPPMPHLKSEISRNHSIFSPGEESKKFVSKYVWSYFGV